tara:strand:- start:6700 stop:7398 length:699 start_codon:yes stop_codon:yes gene_type:complete
MELDFSNQIKAKHLDALTYTETPNVFLKTANSNFKHMDINVNALLNIYPPKNSSLETKKELSQIKNFMESNHSKEFKSSLKKMDEDPALFVIDHYKSMSGRNIPSEALKFISGGDVEVLAMKLKMHYNRPRPYQIAEHYGIKLNYNKSIQKGAADHPSYPSGHTLSAFFTAKVLGFIDREFSVQLNQKAQMVADSRIMEGVHFKSDNDFSIFLVDKVLMPAFLKAYDGKRNT